jgi:hypothetical protein
MMTEQTEPYKESMEVQVMKKVYIASPLGGDVRGNIERAKEYAKYALECGAAPVVPHFYALILDDNEPEERKLGLKAGQTILTACDEVWVFGSVLSPGMKAEIELADRHDIKTRYFDRTPNLIGGTQFYEKKKGIHAPSRRYCVADAGLPVQHDSIRGGGCGAGGGEHMDDREGSDQKGGRQRGVSRTGYDSGGIVFC